jgi:hypothetical protein
MLLNVKGGDYISYKLRRSPLFFYFDSSIASKVFQLIFFNLTGSQSSVKITW